MSCQQRLIYSQSDCSIAPTVSHLLYLGFSLDGSTMFQQDLDNANMTIPGCTVERSQLILQRDEKGERPVEVLVCGIRDGNGQQGG